MPTRTASLSRFLLTLALASLVLVLLPPILMAQQNFAAVPEEGDLPAAVMGRGQPLEISKVPTATPASLSLHFAGSAIAHTPFTLTQELAFKLHPTLLKEWLSGAHEATPVIIQLRAQADLNRRSIVSASSVAERRAALVGELQATATRSQADLLAVLTEAQQTDRVSGIRSLWINNSIAAHLDRDMLLSIAARDDVAFVQPDRYRQWIDTDFYSDTASSLQPPNSDQWHIQRVRADQVWSVLNITGTGVVVGNMDTGVDWQHSALRSNYRGYNPKGLPTHLFSWFDATNEAALYPYDGYGHGTHTMGTLAGVEGIGVAPGAKWIAARIFESNGYALDSWIHAGFQWMLAPGGDPDQAPDVLSNSWGNDDGYNMGFQADVRLLNMAGIDTFFSNGNAGPEAVSVGAPASYPESFGVGAVDDTDWVAGFSSRGPSPWGDVKPAVVAPGVAILSSVPGGRYLKANGTSMAVPQVAGTAALMRSAVAGLTITQTRYVLTSTAAHSLNDVYPNFDYGWGRVDAFNAVMSVFSAGSISGTIRRSDTLAPVPYAHVHAVSRLGTWNDVSADKFGHYTLFGAASLYTLTVSAFGYTPLTLAAVPIVTGTVTQRDATLSPLPTGWVTGRVTDITGTHLLTVSLSVQQAPVSITARGMYSWALPLGTHVLRAQADGHRIVTAEVTITVGQTVTRDFMLPAAPSILLVDSGRWYNGSAIPYYRQALADLNYLYDDWPIRDLRIDLPTTHTLRAYNVVIWSAPLDSPGVLGVSYVMSDFLGKGGRLLLSGQDVGYYDDGAPYYADQILAAFMADNASTRHLTGKGSFTGLTLAISGTDGADNQIYPDVIRSHNPALTTQAFDYGAGQSGGQSAGQCRPYRAVYLPFGFEAINDRATRAEVLLRTFGIFDRALVRNVFAFAPTPDQLIAPPGAVATSTIALTSFDEVAPFTFTLSAQSAWAVTLTPTQVSLPSCQSRPLTITVRIPPDATRDNSQSITVTAQSIVSPGLIVSTVLTVKAPASVLLVEDDRWYEMGGAYRSALAANGIPFDAWRVPTGWSGPEPATPSINRLKWYPQVIWFTGYDWYQTLTPSNTQALQAYLQQGGRLLLSSQEFLSTMGMADFKRQTLGVLTVSTDMTTALVSGVRGGLFDGLIQQPLNYPYPNYDDALAPQPGTQVALVGDHGWPVALAHDMGISKTLFMAFGFEGLPAASQPEAMDRAIGYLSRLGRSSVAITQGVARPGEMVSATITIVNDGAASIKHAAVTLTLPSAMTYLGGDALTWSGELGLGQVVTRSVSLKLADVISAGTIVTLPVEFRDADQAIRFTRAARINVAGPELKLSYAPSKATAFTDQVVTWTLTARNIGALATPVTAALDTPIDQMWIDGSLQWNTGLLINHGEWLGWNGTLGVDEALTVTYRMTTPWTLTPVVLYGSASAATDQTVWQAGGYLQVEPYRVFLPLLRK